ncbi:MAG: ATP synthase subunit I [Limnohabitans sp.]
MPCNPVHPDDEFKPLTAQEAQALRERVPLLSIWRVVGVQAGVAVVAAALAWLLTGRESVMLSVAYGGLSVVLPSALFARGMTSRLTRVNLGSAVAGFVLWELVKIALTVAMLFMAKGWITDVSWPALLVGFVVTMKVHWVVLGLGRKLHPKVKS